MVIEGIDGAGKTTLQRGIAEALRARGRTVIETKEPTDGPLGRRIREIAATGRTGVTPQEELRLFHEDRTEHVALVVRPALERGEVVVQDRSFFSTVAYQGERGLDRARLLEQSRRVAPDPDVLLVVDIPAETALHRIRSGRGVPTDDFETLESLSRVRDVFLGFTDAIVIDGMQSPEQVLAASLRAIDDAEVSCETRRSPG